MKRLISILLCLMFVFSFTGCDGGSGELASYRPITDIYNLEGRRVGCVVGWETDYILSGRDDLTLRRYDSIGEMVMALCYKQLDAIACDEETVKLVFASVDGVELVEPQIGQIGYTFLTYNNRQDLIDEFNEWISEFINTEDYAEYEERNHSFDGINYVPIEIEEAQNPTKEITIGYSELYYPMAFNDTDGSAKGTDIEILQYFARDKGYKINFMYCSSGVMQLLEAGKIDAYAGGLTDIYKEEYESTGLYLMSDAFRYSSVNLVQVNDFDNLRMKAAITE